MFIAIVGTRASGKTTIRDYLIKAKGFICLRLLEQQDASQESDSRRLSHLSLSQTSGGGSMDSSARNVHPDSSSTPSSLAFYGKLRSKHLSFLSMEGEPSPLSSPGSRPVDLEILSFTSADDLLLFVTRNWQSDFVTLDLKTREVLEMFTLRPFTIIIHIDAPLLDRFQRSHSANLESFVSEDDECVFNSAVGLETLRELVNLRINNVFPSISHLHSHLEGLDLADPERLRPNWDTYFMTLADLASRRSNCMKRRVGAVLVRDRRIVATGYNGTPRNVKNCNEGGCSRCNSATDDASECVCLHAEENALLEAGRERVGTGSVLYCNTCPCLKCTIKIIQTGVKEVVYNLEYKVDSDSASLFEEAGIQLRRFNPHGPKHIPVIASTSADDTQ